MPAGRNTARQACGPSIRTSSLQLSLVWCIKMFIHGIFPTCQQHVAKGQSAKRAPLLINLIAQQVGKQVKLHQKAVAFLETVSKAATAQSTEMGRLQKSEKDTTKQAKAIGKKVGSARELLRREAVQSCHAAIAWRHWQVQHAVCRHADKCCKRQTQPHGTVVLSTDDEENLLILWCAADREARQRRQSCRPTQKHGKEASAAELQAAIALQSTGDY